MLMFLFKKIPKIGEDFCKFYQFYVYKIVFFVVHRDTHKIKFFIKYFFSKRKIRRKLQIWSHLLKIYLTENSIFWQCHQSVLVFLGTHHKLPFHRLSNMSSNGVNTWPFPLKTQLMITENLTLYYKFKKNNDCEQFKYSLTDRSKKLVNKLP